MLARKASTVDAKEFIRQQALVGYGVASRQGRPHLRFELYEELDFTGTGLGRLHAVPDDRAERPVTAATILALYAPRSDRTRSYSAL
jgi:hypothetical protein